MIAALALAVLAAPAQAQEAPAVVAAEPPRKLAVGTASTFQPGLLLQAWYAGAVAGGDVGSYGSTFRARRVEISGKGEVIPGRVAYGFVIDPARLLEFQDRAVPVGMTGETVTVRQPAGASSILQDAYATLLTSYADVSIGQFKIPVSWEGFNSSSRLLLPERAVVARELGDRRDIGVRAAHTSRWFSYVAGLYNGSGPNALDANRAKDAALRLEVFPLAGVMVGGMAYGSIGQRGSAGAKDRYEADARAEWGPLLVQAEYLRGHDVPRDVAVDSEGFYAAAAVRVVQPLQLVLRAGHFDPDTAHDAVPASPALRDEVWHVEAGLTWYALANEAKLQLAYAHFGYDDRAAGDELIVAAQVQY